MSLTSTPIRKAPPEAMYLAAMGRKNSPTAKYMTYKGTNYKIASADARKFAKMKDFVRSRQGQIGLAAGLTGAVGVGSSLYSSRKDEKGLTRSQKKLLEQEAALDKKEELSGKTKSTHRERQLLDLRKKISDFEARNPKVSAAGKGAAGAAIGGALMRRQLRSGS